MGWTNSHLHQFITTKGRDRNFYGMLDPYGDGDGMTLDKGRYTVAGLAKAAKQKFVYEYDFGAGWEHDVVVEKILPDDPAFLYPICLKGKGACPLEDCGGISGYHRLLEILSDPKHPEHEQMMEWSGGSTDASLFEVEAANANLKRLKA